MACAATVSPNLPKKRLLGRQGGLKKARARPLARARPEVVTLLAHPSEILIVAGKRWTHPRWLARPDGNMPGTSLLSTELDGKRLEILIEALPGLRGTSASVTLARVGRFHVLFLGSPEGSS
jgi:hypothetical protein